MNYYNVYGAGTDYFVLAATAKEAVDKVSAHKTMDGTYEKQSCDGLLAILIDINATNGVYEV